MRPCPFCGRPLEGAMPDGEPVVRCSDEICLFNFQDETCPECGEPPDRIENPDPETYRVYCARGHEWAACQHRGTVPVPS